MAAQDATHEDLEEITTNPDDPSEDSVEDLALQLMRQLRACPHTLGSATHLPAENDMHATASSLEPDSAPSKRPGLQDALNSVLTALGEGDFVPNSVDCIRFFMQKR